MNDPYNPSGGGYQQGGYQQGGGYQGAGGGYQQGGGYQGPGYPGGGFAPQQDYQRGYLQGAPVDFMTAIRSQFQNITNFNGRASRSAYWWYALPLIVVDIILYAALPTAIYYILALIVGLSALSLAVRRLHDTDKSGWMILLGLIPIIGGIIVLVFMCLPGTPGQNRFG